MNHKQNLCFLSVMAQIKDNSPDAPNFQQHQWQSLLSRATTEAAQRFKFWLPWLIWLWCSVRSPSWHNLLHLWRETKPLDCAFVDWSHSIWDTLFFFFLNWRIVLYLNSSRQNYSWNIEKLKINKKCVFYTHFFVC